MRNARTRVRDKRVIVHYVFTYYTWLRYITRRECFAGEKKMAAPGCGLTADITSLNRNFSPVLLNRDRETRRALGGKLFEETIKQFVRPFAPATLRQ